MTIIRNLLETRNADADLGSFLRSKRLSGAVSVSGYPALAHSAAYACVNLIADGVSSLPVATYKKSDGYPERVTSPEIITNPSPWGISDNDWRREVLVSWLTAGNFFGDVVERDEFARPTKIEPLDPFTVTVVEDPNTFKLTYSVAGKKVEDPDRIIHRPGLLLPGSRIGVTPLGYAAKQIALGLNAQKYAQDYYTRGVKTNALITVPGNPDEQKAERIKRKFIDSAQVAHEPVVMFDGASITPLNINASDTLFLETINASGQDTARFFLMPPEMIGLDGGNSMTYSNIESRSRHLLNYTYNPWIIRLEKFQTSLIPGDLYVKANRDAALAIDTSTRYNAHQTAIRAGFKTVNEVRAQEELPPTTDGNGDTTLWPPYAFGQVGQAEPIGQD